MIDQGPGSFAPTGWNAVLVPRHVVIDPKQSPSGRVRPPFGLFDHQFRHADAGDVSVTFLYHVATGFRLAHFMTPELAVEAADILVPLTNWDDLLANARTTAEARQRAAWFTRELKDFTPFEWFVDNLLTLTRPYRPDAKL